MWEPTLSPLVSKKTAGKLRVRNIVTLVCTAKTVRVSSPGTALWETATIGKNSATHTNRANARVRKNIGIWSALSQKILQNFSINLRGILRIICNASKNRREISRENKKKKTKKKQWIKNI